MAGSGRTCPPRVQAKLTVNQPGDAYEQEADRVAEAVLRMPDPGIPAAERWGDAPGLQRQACPECEEEVRRQPLEEENKEEEELRLQPTAEEEREEEEPLMANELPGRVPEVTPSLEADIRALKGGGQPLPESERAFFEPRFAQDFSKVRVHTGREAAESAQALNAIAYTVGSNIVFGANAYGPEILEGRRLLAHELSHVVQQSRERGTPTKILCLGANPGCAGAQRTALHQAIFDARGWINKAITNLQARPLLTQVVSSLSRNFGPTYGVPANIPLIVSRLRVAYNQLSTIPIGCAGVADAICAAGHCGYTPGAGTHSATICSNVTLPPAGIDTVFRAGCVLHESLHAAFSNFTVDEYSGWHGHAGATATYPGTLTDPLLNSDSYTTLVMDLS